MRPARAILYLRRFPMPEAAKKLKRKSEARIRLLSQPPLDWPLAIIVLTLVIVQTERLTARQPAAGSQPLPLAVGASR